MPTIKAPWPPELVKALNDYQGNPAFHPYTCANGRDDRHPDREGILRATPNGWVCDHCGYKQSWCCGFHAVELK